MTTTTMETAGVFWIRAVARTQPVFTDPAIADPFTKEADALILKGHKAGGLSPAEMLRLNVLARLLGWGVTREEIEAAINWRLQRLLEG